MLAETGLPYEAHLVDFGKNDQQRPEFLSLNPNGRFLRFSIPTGQAESHSVYSNQARYWAISPTRPASSFRKIRRVGLRPCSGCISRWVALAQCSGRLGFSTNSRGRPYEDKRPLQRYVSESKRLLGVIDNGLDDRQWIMGDEYTIADISMLGWVRNLIGFYEARELVEFDTLRNVPVWLERSLARPAVQRGLNIPA